MNIIAKAKPIRIRIISGGEEHFSLDTLRGNLCVQDIFPLIIDGRLSRWLDQQGQRELAEEIKSRFSLTSDIEKLDEISYFDVLKILLAEDVARFNPSDLYELYSKWHDDSLYRGSKNFLSFHKYLLNSQQGVQFLSEKYLEELSLEDWKQADKILRQAGVSINLLRSSWYTLSPDEQKAVEDNISQWKNDKIGYFRKSGSSNSNAVRCAILFLRQISRMWYATFYEHDGSLERWTESEYRSINNSDALYREKRFLFGLAKYHNDKQNVALVNFRELAHNYPLALEMLNKSKDKQYMINGENFVDASFINQQEFIIDNLYKF